MIYPKQYPTVVIDDFFDNPSIIRDFALSLSYERDADGRWPGERTPMLHTIDESLVYALAKKIMSIYFDNGTHIYWDNIQMAFQKIKPYSPDRNSSLNSGWIHTDGARTFAGVVYLTPNAPMHTGTTIYKYKEEYDGYTELTSENKRKLYLGKSFDKKEYDKELTEMHKRYDVITEVKNVYNRCIQYDARQWHTGTNYWSNGEDRLSLVYFFTNVRAPFTPYQRQICHDQEILDKINKL